MEKNASLSRKLKAALKVMIVVFQLLAIVTLIAGSIYSYRWLKYASGVEVETVVRTLSGGEHYQSSWIGREIWGIKNGMDPDSINGWPGQLDRIVEKCRLKEFNRQGWVLVFYQDEDCQDILVESVINWFMLDHCFFRSSSTDQPEIRFHCSMDEHSFVEQLYFRTMRLKDVVEMTARIQLFKHHWGMLLPLT